MTTYYAYVKRSNSDWGTTLKSTTLHAAKLEARSLFRDEYRDATIHLCDVTADGFRYPIAMSRVTERGWREIA